MSIRNNFQKNKQKNKGRKNNRKQAKVNRNPFVTNKKQTEKNNKQEICSCKYESICSKQTGKQIINKKQAYVNMNLLVLPFLLTAILNIDLKTFLSETVRNEMKPN